MQRGFDFIQHIPGIHKLPFFKGTAGDKAFGTTGDIHRLNGLEAAEICPADAVRLGLNGRGRNRGQRLCSHHGQRGKK
ncbi:hypothetical protein D3C80_2022650 [compost metagenome]